MSKIIKWLILFLLTLSGNTLRAQSPSSESLERFTFPAKEWNVGLSYFGEFLLRPGFSIAADYPIWSWGKTKDKKKGEKYRGLALHLGGRYWNYRQTKSHNGNAIDMEFFIRKTKAFGYKNKIGILDFGISAGLGWNKLHGGIYKTTEDGFEKANRRQAFFSSGFFMSFGRKLDNKKNIPLHWYIKPKIVIETPYAPFPQIHPSLELGVNFPLAYLKNSKK